MAVPTSTYRVHLTHEFTLHDAAELVDHLDRLGVGWAYASPIQTVPAGAAHGYHITDPGTINPELGGTDGLHHLHHELHGRGMGLLLDIVPNHMAASPENVWWADLLRHGPDSAHARTFDVDLGTPAAPRPIVLPVLGEPLEQAIADGQVTVDVDSRRLVVHGDLHLPLADNTDLTTSIEEVLEQQHYRLHVWHEGERILNWRRFFAVNELVGVRVENPDVLSATHRLLLMLLRHGTVTGLRIDHIDGLADPGGYLRRLRQLIGDDTYVLVEKIVERDEVLPADWPVAGTTGYETGNAIAQWLLDHEGHLRLTRTFEAATGLVGPVADALPQSKLHVLDNLFEAEVEAVRRLLGPVDGVAEPDVSQIIRLVAAHIDGYRTYVGPEGPISPDDDRRLSAAIQAASLTSGRSADVVGAALMADAGRPALLRLQQLTGPAAAKGFEDRLLYRHVALSSLCEVGADAGSLDDPWRPARAAQALVDRQTTAPDAGTISSTHDTKRAEDVRAVIHVLAEVPEGFTGLLERLEQLKAPAGTDALSRWLLTQTAVALMALDRDTPEALVTRLRSYAGKALREAEVATDHSQPDEAYEAAVADWVRWLLTDEDAISALEALALEVRVPGLVNALAATVLKLIAPGVPDIYRGTEIWDDSLVDPDNRRPLDLPALERALLRVEALTGPDPLAPTGDLVEGGTDLRDGWHDGAVKLHLIRTGLHLRRHRPELFRSGAASAPVAGGSAADHVVALRRDHDGGGVLAVGTRLPHRLAGSRWPIGAVWGDTSVPLDLPEDRSVTELLTGRTLRTDRPALAMSDVLAVLPVALISW